MAYTDQALTVAESREWQDAARYFAGRGRLPMLLSARVWREIESCPDEWAEAVRLARYALACEQTEREAR